MKEIELDFQQSDYSSFVLWLQKAKFCDTKNNR